MLAARYPKTGFKQSLVKKGDAKAKSRILSSITRPPTPDPRILDIGTGNASFAVQAAQRLRLPQVYVLDGVTLTDEWEKQTLDTSIFVNGIVVDLDDPLPYADESFGVILSIHVIEHLYDPFHHLREIYRVLKKQGYAIIGAPNLSGLQYRLMLLFGLMPTTLTVGMYQYDSTTGQETPYIPKYLRHISCLTLGEFRKVLSLCGFEAIETRTSVIHLLPGFLEKLLTKLFPWGNYMFFKVRKV